MPPAGKLHPKPLCIPTKGKQVKGPKEKPHKKASSLKIGTKVGKKIYTIKQRLQILQVWNEIQNGTGRKTIVANNYGVDPTTIRRWKKKEAEMKVALE